MIITTTPTLEGRPVRDYLGIVTGEAIIGANIFKDLFAAVRDVVGGRSSAYERALSNARAHDLRQMAERAADRGANAVVSVDLDYEVINNMLMVTAAGTAVET